jgi:hypothetical protein
MREFRERLPLSVSSVGMKPDVIVPTPSMPAVMPAVEKCLAAPPTQGLASGDSANGLVGTVETVAVKQSLKERVFHAFSNLGDFVAGEEPVILPIGKDYLMGDDIQQKAAFMERKVLGATELAIPAIRKGYAAGKLVIEGAKAVAEAIKPEGPGGLTLAIPKGATLTRALEVAPAVAGVPEDIGVGTVTAAAAGSDFPLSISLKQEKTPGQRDFGSAGTCEDLKAGKGSGGFPDKRDVHQIVPQRYLKKHDVPEEDGLSVVLPKEVHAQTNTFKYRAKNFELDQSFRDATAERLRDAIRVEKEHGELLKCGAHLTSALISAPSLKLDGKLNGPAFCPSREK